jgi:hypothetical protein
VPRVVCVLTKTRWEGDVRFLRLDGPFCYPVWEERKEQATPLSPSRAAAWAAGLPARRLTPGGIVLEEPIGVLRFVVSDVELRSSPVVPSAIVDAVPPTRPDGAAAFAREAIDYPGRPQDEDP